MLRTFSCCCSVALGLLVLCRAGYGADPPDNFVDELVVGGLDEPTGMAFLPDGRLLLVEQRSGKVRMVVNGQLAASNLVTIPNLSAGDAERGLQCLAVDPGWPSRPYVYFVHNRSGNAIRLVRYTASGALSDPAGQILSLSTPLLLLDDLPDSGPNHNGGTLRFGIDGRLYVSLGEDSDQCSAQDSTSLKGALLRLDVSRLPAGGGGPVPKALLIPPDPAFSTPDSNARMVHAYGMRNPWRFQIDAATGAIYLGDVGESSYEEIDEVGPGMNLGWPFREGNQVRTSPVCNEPGGSGSGLFDRPLLPVTHSPAGSAILIAGVYHPRPQGGSNWPLSYDGDLFYSDYVGGYLRRLKRTSDWGAAAPVPGQPNGVDWATGLTWPVDFQVGPDGSLWYLAQFDGARANRSGMVRRIRYTGAAVDAPLAGPAPGGLRLAPNPFVKTTDVHFTLVAPERVRLAVFDANGRRIRTLLDGRAPAGDSRLRWNGADDRGEPAAPGLYFVRLERSGAVETLRVLRLR